MPHMDMPMDYHVSDDIQMAKHLYHFATDFDRVLLQLVGTDIVNTVKVQSKP